MKSLKINTTLQVLNTCSMFFSSTTLSGISASLIIFMTDIHSFRNDANARSIRRSLNLTKLCSAQPELGMQLKICHPRTNNMFSSIQTIGARGHG